jgi:hydrogenase maturation protease
MHSPPGTIKKFTPDEVKTVKKLADQSLHESDLLKIIEMSKQLGECPKQIVIFGIEPAEIKECSSLSRTIAGKIEYYISVITEEIRTNRAANVNER